MNLADHFLAGLALDPDAVALQILERTRTYGELHRAASRLAELIDSITPGFPELVGVLGSETFAAYEAILASLLGGGGYVPLSPHTPPRRIAGVLRATEARVLVADASAAGVVREVAEEMAEAMPTLVLAGWSDADASALRAALGGRVRVLRDGDGAAEGPGDPAAGGRTHEAGGEARVPLPDAPSRPDAPAYVMFTSGSTGTPKGVCITHRNADAFLRETDRHWSFGPDDRVSQMFDLTFDVSVFCTFAAWRSGARLCVFPRASRTFPKALIGRYELTVWSSVPSVGAIMRQLGLLAPGAYPTLRHCIFAGEAFPTDLAAAWQEAAPGAVVENHYGPTEVTVFCTGYRWSAADPERKTRTGVVPIGPPYSSVEAALVDEDLGPVAPGEIGELCMRGSQVSPGYWRDPERTAASFVPMPWLPAGPDNRWYRTGDRVLRDEDGDLHFFGRADHQVKITGYRVELGEIEACLRRATGLDLVVALPWPLDAEAPTGVVAAVQGAMDDPGAALAACAAELPPYMVPRELHAFASLPLNPNGKIDRRAVRESVRQREAAADGRPDAPAS